MPTLWWLRPVKSRARRRTQRRDVKIREAQSTRGEIVDMGRLEIRAETVEVRKAQVVDQDHDDVGSTVARMRGRWPPGCGVRQRSTNGALEWFVALHAPPWLFGHDRPARSSALRTSATCQVLRAWGHSRDRRTKPPRRRRRSLAARRPLDQRHARAPPKRRRCARRPHH